VKSYLALRRGHVVEKKGPASSFQKGGGWRRIREGPPAKRLLENRTPRGRGGGGERGGSAPFTFAFLITP